MVVQIGGPEPTPKPFPRAFLKQFADEIGEDTLSICDWREAGEGFIPQRPEEEPLLDAGSMCRLLNSHRVASTGAKAIPLSWRQKLWKPQKQFQHPRIIWRAQPCNGIPAFNGREAHCIAPRIRSVRDIIQHVRMRIQRWVEEADRPFANCQSLLVDAVDDG
jgi:hypothetical protein